MMRTGYGEIFATRGNRYDDSMARWPAARDAEFAAMCRYLAATGGETLVDAPAGGAYLRRYLPADVEYIAVDEAEQFHTACAPGTGRSTRPTSTCRWPTPASTCSAA
jgi:hypothetical protein